MNLKKNLQKLMGGSDCPFKSSTVIEAGEFSYLMYSNTCPHTPVYVSFVYCIRGW
jgi:hypothetical protein